VFEIHIEPNGSVGSVTILKTTGHTILDAAAITGFRQWRFRPHTIDIVRVPVQYRITLSSVRWGSRSRLKNIGDGDAVVIMAGKALADKHVTLHDQSAEPTNDRLDCSMFDLATAPPLVDGDAL
jgi:TonB family protein